jgi:hypothetical protein
MNIVQIDIMFAETFEWQSGKGRVNKAIISRHPGCLGFNGMLS